MFAVKLECPSCSYSSDVFIEGPSIHDEKYYVIEVREDRTFEIVGVTANKAQKDSSRHDRVILETHPGKEEMLDIKCPCCGCLPIRKRIIGLD